MAIIKELIYDFNAMFIMKAFLLKVTTISEFNQKVLSTCRAVSMLQGYMRRFMLSKALLKEVEKMKAKLALDVKAKKKRAKRKKIAQLHRNQT